MPTPAPMAPPINAPFSSESRSCADAWPGDTTSDAISAAANVTCFMCLIMLINRRYASSGPLNEHCRHKTRRTESAPARLFQSRQRDGLRCSPSARFTDFDERAVTTVAELNTRELGIARRWRLGSTRMATEEERCAEAKKLQRIDEAFIAGDLEALRAAVDDPSVIPNGQMPLTVGSCLVYAIYCSPLAFIRTLLEIGADPNAPVDDGFPPLIAALSCSGSVPGSKPRTDVDDIVRLLLSFGADPHVRGINDYTALHMAVGEGNALAVQRLLDAGADPELRTRIDDCDTPLEMARSGNRADIVAILERKGQPENRRLR